VAELEKSLVANREMIKKVGAIKPTPLTTTTTPPAPIRELDDRPSSLPKPAFVQAAPLPSTPTKVEVDKGAIREVDQQLAAARERVDKAEAALVARRFTSTRKGKVVRILVKPGEHVKAGQVIAIIQ
jgi:biotin carboxyl carrier protein